MRPLIVFYQDCIARSHDVGALTEPLTSLIRIEDWRSQLDAIEASPEIHRVRPLVFASILVAGHIQRSCPALARGVILQKDFMRHHTYSSIIPGDMLLNPGGIYLPWGRIPTMKDELKQLFGDHIFIRPDSSTKPFTGFSVRLEDMGFEHAAMSRAAHMSPEEMCFVTSHIDVPGVEYRCWVVDGQVATSASYGWEGHEEAIGRAPDSVIKAAEKVAQVIEMREQVFTADIVEMTDGPRLVELNAISTSGWYDAMSPSDLISALDDVLI